MALQIAIYALLGFFIILVEIGRKKEVVFDMMSFFNLFFFLVYSVVPIILFIGGVEEYASSNLSNGVFYFGKSIFMPFIIFIAYLTFLGGYYWSIPRRLVSDLQFEFQLTEEMILKIIPFLFLILFFSLYVYIMQFGGLRETIAVAELYRNGKLDPPKYGFMMRFFQINHFILYYTFFKVFLEKTSKYKNIYLIFFLISLGVFALITVLFNSRSYIILTFLGFYVIAAIYKNRYYLLGVSLAILAAVLIIEYGDPFFLAFPALYNEGIEAFIEEFLRAKEHEYSIGFAGIVRNFSHPIVSLETALAIAGYSLEFNKFFELIVSLLNLIPQKLTGYTPPKSIMEINTFYTYGMVGHPAILPGLLGNFAYSLGAVGVWIGTFVYGIQGGVLNEIFLNVYKKYKGFVVFYYLFAFNYGFFLFKGDFIHGLKGNFLLIVSVLILLFFSKVYREKRYV